MARDLAARGQSLADAAAAVVASPAEPRLVWLRRERRARKVARRKLQVVLHRGEVVRAIGMEQRSQVLELPTSRALFEHAPAVRADAVRRAVVVRLEQATDATEAGGLEVEKAGSPGQCLDV